MRNNRVWVVSGVYYPEDAGAAHFITKVAEGLASEFSVKVLCGQPTYSKHETPAPSREQHGKVDIIRCPSTTLNRNKLIPRIIDLITLSVSIFVMAIRFFRKNDLVLVATDPPSLPPIVALACHLRGARYIIRIDDLFPDVMIAGGLLSRRGALLRMLSHVTIWSYNKAECIITLGRDMKALVAKRCKHPERVHIITTWADLDLLSPAPKKNNALLGELGLIDKFVVQWAGNMGYPHEIESILNAMIRLKDHPDIHFIFIGYGCKRPWLEARTREANLKNATFLGYRSRNEQQDFLNACDIALSSYVKGMTGLGVPSRTYNIMAVGKPILAIGDPDSEVALVINEERVGWLVPPNQPDQIVRIILEARDNPKILTEMGARARLAAEKRYSFDLALNRYLEIFRTRLALRDSRCSHTN